MLVSNSAFYILCCTTIRIFKPFPSCESHLSARHSSASACSSSIRHVKDFAAWMVLFHWKYIVILTCNPNFVKNKSSIGIEIKYVHKNTIQYVIIIKKYVYYQKCVHNKRRVEPFVRVSVTSINQAHLRVSIDRP